MLSLFAAATLGFFGNKYISIYRTEAGTQNLELHDQELLADVSQLWVALVALCAWSINVGRIARRWTDTVALPLIAAFGLTIPALPTLPQVPTQDRLTA